MFADRQLSFENIKADGDLKLSEDEYLSQVADNTVATEKALRTRKSVLKSTDYQKLHQIMNFGIDNNAGIIDGQRRLKFFDERGQRNMVDGERIHQELRLLDQQMKELMRRAGDSKEEKVKVVAIQAMRLFAIHPFNDANKRMVKLLIRNFMEKELKTVQRPHWENISKKGNQPSSTWQQCRPIGSFTL